MLLKYRKINMPNLLNTLPFLLMGIFCPFSGKDMLAIYIGMESAKIIAFCNANTFFLGIDRFKLPSLFPGPVVQTSLK